MESYRELTTRRTEIGTPMPLESFGMDPMFGLDDWCRHCGTARSDQWGSLVLHSWKRKRMPRGWTTKHGEWLCIDGEAASVVAEAVPDVRLEPVMWHAGNRGPCYQVVPRIDQRRWFSDSAIAGAALRRGHPSPGRRCDACGLFRWFPVELDLLPLDEVPGLEDPVVASPEVYGDGWTYLRHTVYRADLAEVLTDATDGELTFEPAGYPRDPIDPLFL
ncbi:hypothetical protein QE364_003988 [Nocardioides zeae]|uniref:Uncharacterized protein n=1 Tax=Nocardioides zeae TaxID=1457234 RepID=A0ACC6INL0_9ACTN|nr:hypothetical protein [Nocardioides zeae]MDR6173388.1 hypothetical protein [Nocardioides zeae]MDR6212253.1 hypothetical protein [Nocardioides zeae]